MKNKYKNIEEILEKTEKAMGKKIKEFIAEEDSVSYNAKGDIGNIIETGLFGLKLNNEQAPDFEYLGVELKTTGYKWVYNETKVSAKERLVITMIDYFNDINKDFYDTHLYDKIEKLLIIFYEYSKNKDKYEFPLTNYYFYEFDNIPEKDKLIIIKDWEKIMQKIKEGKAHELSEGDTMYLGACPKGADSKSLRPQPFNSILAMSRAYSLKTTYMTYFLRSKVFNKIESRESLIKDLNLIRNYSIEKIIDDLFLPFKNKTLDEIDILINKKIPRKSNKQLMKSYLSKMMKISESNYEHIEEFQKANIQIKTVTIEHNNKLKESMSFPSMDFIKVSNETWNNSELKEFFETTKFLFAVFKKNKNNKNKNYKFLGAFLWNMPNKTIECNIKEVWEKTNHVLNNNIEIRVKKNRVYNNFPKSTENTVSHVRPHGSKRSTTKDLPKTTSITVLENDNSVDLSIFFKNHKYTSMCFWLNSSYILSLIDDANII